MCPSYRVTRDERDVTRGRANTLRLAITGQLGPDALTSDEMAETLKLCVSCKALPARMPDRRRHGAHEDRGAGGARREVRAVAARPAGRLSAALCAAMPAKVPWLLNLRDRAAGRGEAVARALAGFSARRTLPRWRPRCVPPTQRVAATPPADAARGRAVRRHLQPLFRARESRRRARRARRRRLSRARRAAGRTAARPLCCGRTFLSVGPVDEARQRGRARRSPRSSPSSRAACRWSAWSRAASSASATRSRRCSRRRRASGSPRMPYCSRNSWRARPRPGGLKLPLEPVAQARAAARPLPPEGVRRDGRGRDAC